MPLKIVELTNWNRLLETFEALPSGWLFRGQGNADWDLQTSLERTAPTHQPRSKSEATLLYEFKRRAHMYLPREHQPDEKDVGEWLAVMQHFGAPTRLLDVTRSPYVATYFAIEELKEGKCAIWAVNWGWCLEAAGDVILSRHPDQKTVLEKAIANNLLPATWKNLRLGVIQGMESAALLGDAWLTKAESVVVPFVPRRLSERLSIQQGEFLVPRDVDRTFMQNLDDLGDAGDHIVKYTIPFEARGRILERLRIMNISRAQLFPGLDGFAQSFRQLLVEESPESRNRRMLLDALRGALDRT